MKLPKGLLYTVVVVAGLIAFGWIFVSELGPGSGRSDEPAGVLLSPPPGYAIVERGELASSAAAAELEALVLRPGAGRVGLHFKTQGAEVYWLADAAENLLEERSASSSGTRLQTVWRGGTRERLGWARTHGNFDAPGLPPAERKNLYH